MRRKKRKRGEICMRDLMAHLVGHHVEVLAMLRRGARETPDGVDFLLGNKRVTLVLRALDGSLFGVRARPPSERDFGHQIVRYVASEFAKP